MRAPRAHVATEDSRSGFKKGCSSFPYRETQATGVISAGARLARLRSSYPDQTPDDAAAHDGADARSDGETHVFRYFDLTR